MLFRVLFIKQRRSLLLPNSTKGMTRTRPTVPIFTSVGEIPSMLHVTHVCVGDDGGYLMAKRDERKARKKRKFVNTILFIQNGSYSYYVILMCG